MLCKKTSLASNCWIYSRKNVLIGKGSLVNSRVFEIDKNFVMILFARSNSGISKFLNSSLLDGETVSCKNCK